MYTDDILLVSRNPQTAVPIIGSLIDSFSQISGYKINWTKSEAMPISNTSTESFSTGWPFRLVPSGIMYLGIKFMDNIMELMQANLTYMELHNWSNLNISLLGRVNSIKMIIIPKVNYLIYMLPLPFPAKLLKEYDSLNHLYGKRGKKPLFNCMKLYAAMDAGGLSLPRLDWYHCSFSLAQLSKSKKPLIELLFGCKLKKKYLNLFALNLL